MPLRPVPWAIGNGAENSVELARAAAFIGSSGSTGVVDPVDFGVTALPTPGGAVRVKLGTGVIRSTYPGVVGQSYVVQEQSFTDVPVAATGSSGAAVKYVYVLITDTQYGGQNPPSVENGPYNDYAVSTTLPTNQPYLLLARINQPKSTATIQNSHITDLRELAMPKREQLMFGRPRSASDDPSGQPSSANLSWKVADGGEYFPGGSGSPNTFEVEVPEWATRVLIDASWMGVKYANGTNPHGRYWIEWGDEYRNRTWPNNRQWEFATQTMGFDSPGGNNMRDVWRLMQSMHMPAKLRGKTITFAFKGGRNDTGPANAVSMDGVGGLGVQLAFAQTTLDPKNMGDPA